jgi:hypothetical protein
VIPQNITREHVLNALAEIRRDGVPPSRMSKEYILLYEMIEYPPKYVVSKASKYATDKELPYDEFSGGKETNEFLEGRGFSIFKKQRKDFHSETIKANERLSSKFCGGKEKKSVDGNIRTIKVNGKKASMRRSWFPRKYNIDASSFEIFHNERCPECKKTIQRMLESIYGIVLVNHRLSAGTLPDDFPTHPYLSELKTIFDHLQRLRKNQEFVRTRNLPPVDFYVPTLDAIIEFDESQHFTQARKESLRYYPIDLPLGFDVDKWMRLCDEIDAKDAHPNYRDEQRAWYDTLRDFLPIIRRYKPTIRLYAGDYQWCKLNPDSAEDIKIFKLLLAGKTDVEPRKKISVIAKYDIDPKLARIIIIDRWNSDAIVAGDILRAVLNDWPLNTHVHCLITPGAFLTFAWPQEIERTFDNKYPPREVTQTLIGLAEKRCREVITPTVAHALLQYTDSITIGIDSQKKDISISSKLIPYLHIELVALIDLKTGKYHWTGNSYPTTGQERGLVRIDNLSSHFVDIGYGKVMILGCHDLAIFSRRGEKATFNPWRKRIREEFVQLAKAEAPEIVLHHPHTTDSSNIWKACWNTLEKELPSMKYYAGAGTYYNPDGEQRDKLSNVLANTKKGNTIDFIIKLG